MKLSYAGVESLLQNFCIYINRYRSIKIVNHSTDTTTHVKEKETKIITTVKQSAQLNNQHACYSYAKYVFPIIPGQSIVLKAINQATSFQSSNTSTQTRFPTIHHFLPSDKQWAESRIR